MILLTVCEDQLFQKIFIFFKRYIKLFWFETACNQHTLQSMSNRNVCRNRKYVVIENKFHTEPIKKARENYLVHLNSLLIVNILVRKKNPDWYVHRGFVVILLLNGHPEYV